MCDRHLNTNLLVLLHILASATPPIQMSINKFAQYSANLVVLVAQTQYTITLITMCFENQLEQLGVYGFHGNKMK